MKIRNIPTKRIPRRGRAVPVPVVGHCHCVCGVVAAGSGVYRPERRHENGRLGGFEQKAREATRIARHPVQSRCTLPSSAPSTIPRPTAAEGGSPHAAPQQAQVRAAGKSSKGAALATGLTVAGVLLLICALAALPSAIYWLPEALTEGGSYWTWLVEDSMPMLMSLTGGIGCLFGANHIRTTRRMRKNRQYCR